MEYYDVNMKASGFGFVGEESFLTLEEFRPLRHFALLVRGQRLESLREDAGCGED